MTYDEELELVIDTIDYLSDFIYTHDLNENTEFGRKWVEAYRLNVSRFLKLINKGSENEEF